MNSVLKQAKTSKPPPQLVKLHAAQDQLGRLIAENKRGEALKLFLTLLSKAAKFCCKPGFYGDGSVPRFLQEIRQALAGNPKRAAQLTMIDRYLRHVNKHPAPGRLVQVLKLTRGITSALEERKDKKQAAYYLGQALGDNAGILLCPP